MLCLIAVLLISLMPISAAVAAPGGKPDAETIKKIQRSFPEWKLNSSGQCAVSRSNGLWAWKVILERPVAANIRSSFSGNGKGYIILVMVPDLGIDPGKDFIRFFDWSIPGSELKQYTAFLGCGQGYYWYMKSDIARMELFRRTMRISGGDNMDALMADALNVRDYDLFTSRTAVEYFRGRGPEVVPRIRESMETWRKEEKELPIQHLIALKITGSSAAVEELMKIASSKDHAMAHQALSLLTETPFLAPDSFYARALSVPEYTGRVIRIFKSRNKMKMILPRLRKLVRAPRTIAQSVEVLSALRAYDPGFPGYLGKEGLPEYTACNDIMFLMMRMGETPDTLKYVPIEADGAGTPTKMAEEERKRIEPHLEILRKSRDHEAVFAGAVALASYSPPARAVAKEYSSRVRKVGVEIIRMLPADFVIAHFDMLAKSLVQPREQTLLRMIRQEYGGR